MTYIDPASLRFGGLGHGICDIDTGELMPLRRGNVVGVTVSGIQRGIAGTPGEIKGYFCAGKQGSLLCNSPCGVFGIYSMLPEGVTAATYISSDPSVVSVDTAGNLTGVKLGSATVTATAGSCSAAAACHICGRGASLSNDASVCI